MTVTIPLESVLTHAQLADEMGLAEEELEALLPLSWAGDSTRPRARALSDVVTALDRRTPPIRQADLADVTELRDAVAYGAASRVYEAAITVQGDPHDVKRRLFAARFDDEVKGLMPTLGDDSRGSDGIAFTVERG